MSVTAKALWFIENKFDGELDLEAVAAGIEISRFHLSRVFATTIGHSVMSYVRRRRLTEAAVKLAAGAPDILQLAFEAGYGSHEAFTRAFRDQFGTTPENVRAKAALNDLDLQEPLRMPTTPTQPAQTPRMVDGPALLIAGLNAHYAPRANAGIPSQWQKFGPHIGHVENQVGDVTYGVCRAVDASGAFDYVCGVEVSSFSGLSDKWTRLRLTEQHYAVFTHAGHVSLIAATMGAIWNHWLSALGLDPADAPCFERYDERFDPVSGNGGFEIWVPVRA